MELPKKIANKIKDLPAPLIVGVSGFGGSGKSTFANKLGAAINAPVISVDSFMINGSREDYSLWEIMDFKRLQQEVIEPFLKGQNPIRYGQFSWHKNGIAEIKEVTHGGKIIIEGVGLFRPGITESLDYKIWIDCPIEEATERGKRRDQTEHPESWSEQWNAKWDGVWKKNDREYETELRPKEKADLVINNSLSV